MGDKPNDIVSIMIPRNSKLFCAIMGVLKSGAAYLPIDTAYPPDRIDYILKDSGAKYIITSQEQETIAGTIPKLSIEHLLREGKKDNPNRTMNPTDLCYVLYTSGSTGKPKGTMLTHSNAVNFCYSNNNMLLEEILKLPDPVILSATTVLFDIFVTESLFPLLNSIKIVLAAHAQQNDQKECAALILKENCNILQTTPSKMKLLMMDKANCSYLSRLSVIILIGEVFPPSLYNELRSSTSASIYNAYGPTEATVWVSTQKVANAAEITIGKPMANVRFQIINESQPCGIGVPGELCIAGDCLGRGYLNRPDLTAEKFEYNKNLNGERIYHTGDLAMWLMDGSVRYLGRMDDQVKVRGFRIELGEIENAVRRFGSISNAAIMVRNDQICAYFVSDKEVISDELKSFLRLELPEYMVPGFVLQMEKLPMTGSGKVDRKALPAIEFVRNNEFVAPVSELEHKIAKIYADILELDEVSIQDNFFDLGGHSLSATRVLNEIEIVTGVRISLKDIFYNPTIKQLCECIDQVKNIVYESIPKAAAKEYYTMSSQQKRIYFLNDLDSSGISYNMPAILKTYENVTAEHLNQVFQTLVERHKILRTRFDVKEEKSIQIIENNVLASVDYEKAEGCIEEEKLMAEFLKPFDLGKPPLLRIKLVDCQDYHLLLFDMHHIISDAASIRILIQEFVRLFEGLPLEDNVLDYLDYSDWMQGRDLSGQESYWLKEFSGSIPTLDLPVDFTRESTQSFKGDTVSCTLESELCKKTTEMGHNTLTTNYMIFLSGLMVTLSQYSGQDDIVVGSPILGRINKELESVVGMFVNTLAMRGRPSANKRYSEFLREVKETCLKAYDNQEYPFEMLVEKLDIKRNLSRNPLFDVMFALEDSEEEESYLNEAGFTLLEVNEAAAKFDITARVMKDKGNYKINLDYCIDLFEHNFIEQLLEHFCYNLNQIMDNPDILLANLELATDKEKAAILQTLNNTDTDYPNRESVIGLFEEQVRKSEDVRAVIFGDNMVSYQFLNERANQLAHLLRKNGVKPNEYVAVSAEKSIEMIIGVLAILKAGGAYVPLDVTMPAERIRFILEDCKAAVYLEGRKKQELGLHLQVIDLNDERNYESGGKDNLEPISTSEDLIYLMYTSGTTGKPKGVMIKHKSVARLVRNTNYIKFDDITILQTGALSFDASTFEIWGTLLNGGTLVLANNETITNASMMKYMIQKHSINAMFLTTALFNQLISQDVSVFDQLDKLLFGGEKTSAGHVKKLLEVNHKIHLSNVYGPTETTTFALYQPICRKQDLKRVPIGKPISNTKVYILMKNRICGIGMPGEICIAGDGLAGGYLNQQELTDEKFHEFSGTKEKVYRTGDLGRWLPDGTIEFLGRMDEQVKIRGFRIEPQEIENVIRKQDMVKDVTVVVFDDFNGEKQLCAYIVSDHEINNAGMKEKMRKELPEYMVPAYIMKIQNIPVNSNGKVDKKALPAPEISAKEEYKAPRNDQEAQVTSIFSKVLGIKKIGIRDNFFDLGGHSLRATKVINELELLTGLRLPLRTIFTHPTAEALAELLCTSKNEVFISIPKARTKAYYPMSFSQRRIFVISELESLGTVYNIPVAMKMKGKLDQEKIKKVLLTLINRHEILRTGFELFEGQTIQKIYRDVEFELKAFDTRKPLELLMEEFVKPFNLAAAPLIHAAVAANDGESYFLFDIHHLIADGFSVNLFLEEFIKLYHGESLQPLLLQYKDYSQWMHSRDFVLQKEYWVKEFSGDIPVLDLPLDYNRSSKQSYKGNQKTIVISQSMKEKISSFAIETGVTEYMLYLSSVMILLHKYSRQEDIVVGSPISGRIHKDTESMLGVFINTIALQGNPRGDKLFLTFLSEVKETCMRGYENQEYPFEELVETVHINRDMSRNPLFDVMFVFQNNEDITKEADKAGFELIELENKISKMDLSISIMHKKEECEVAFEYCTDLFKETSIELMMQHFIVILEQIIERPGNKIEQIGMMTQQERTIIHEVFNKTQVEFPKERCVHDIFEEHVKMEPDKIILDACDRTMTYLELNEISNQIANELINQGVKRNDIIGVMLPRESFLFCALMGVLKAGAAYLPIDSGYPDERIEYILKDSQVKCVITNEELGKKVHVDSLKLFEKELLKNRQTNDPKQPMAAEDLSYVLYTSGSTGKPKGTMLTHRNAVNFCYTKNNGLLEEILLRENPAILSTTTISFDIFVTESLFPLLNGVRVVFADDIQQNDQRLIAGLVKEKKCSVLQTTPSKMKLYMADKNNCDYLSKLSVIILLGEVFPPSIYKEIREYTNAAIFNAYGPTEATVWVSVQKIEDPQYITIGKPVANTRFYVINGNSQCGIGVPGELCIAGECLARGYLSNKKLTMEKFMEHPYKKGERIYHTGDLVKWLMDGNIQYMGRMDTQVKLRGQRIELGEIEAVLCTVDGITNAAVVIQEDKALDQLLAAYIVSGNQIDTDMVKQEIGRQLPDYMVPSIIVEIDKIPLMQNGKLDKKALPVMETAEHYKYIAPGNELEIKVALLFEDILGVTDPGIRDNFYEIGGDSIKALRLVSKIRELGYEINVKELMTYRTIESICANLKVSNTRHSFYEQGEVSGEVPLTPIQKEFFRWDLPAANHFNQSVMVKGEKLEEALIRLALGKILMHHDILRAVYPGKQQRIELGSPKVPFALDIYNLEDKNESEIGTMILDTCSKIQKCFQIEKGPLIKAALFQTAQGDHLFLCIHHLLVDAVSWHIILEDLNRGYSQAKKHEDIVLPAKTASYRDWSNALQGYSNSGKLIGERAYWEQIIAGARAGGIRGDRQGPSIFKNKVMELDSYHTGRLLHNCSNALKTDINDLLLSALIMSVNQCTGQESASIYLEGHGREELEKPVNIDRTVGWFTTIYPVILQMKETLEETIIRTKENLRKIPAKGIGFGVLKNLENNNWDIPEIDICFNYLGEVDHALNMSADYGNFIQKSEYSGGEDIAEENAGTYNLSFNGSVSDGSLLFRITYNSGKYSKQYIDQLSHHFTDSIKQIISFCSSEKNKGITASDVGAEDLKENEIEEINLLLDDLI